MIGCDRLFEGIHLELWLVLSRVGKVLEFLGLTVASLLEADNQPAARKALEADVVYAKASKLCFAYIEDNIGTQLPEQYVSDSCLGI